MVDVLRVFCALFVGLIVGISGSCPGGTYGFQCGYRCNCPVTRCDAPDGCNLQHCSPGWSGPTCQKHNKALNKPTSASTAYLPAASAVNGDRNHRLGFHSGFKDRTITSAWWRVDLGETTPIRNVTVYFRKDFKVRRNGIQIYIADTAASPTDGVNCYNVTGNRDGTDIPDVLTATCSGEGRYLVLYTNTVNNERYDVPIMDFCEVEVDVCSPGTFGADCANYCHCDGDVCDYVSGVCPGEICRPGWAKETCDTVCDLGYYGANCSNNCLNRNCKDDNSSCDHETGECVGGCSAGWDGTDCTHMCSPGTFGAGCVNYCHCDGDVCDYVSGVCPGGVCLPGWATETCDTVCDLGYYGANCSNICLNRNCKDDNSSCDHETGECVGGCSAGWDGTDCTHICPDGMYGVRCLMECGNCLGEQFCNKNDGSCSGGCSEGYGGDVCKTESHHKLLISAVVGGAAYLLLIIAVSAAAGVCWCTRKNRTGSNRLAYHSQGTPRANHNYENHGTPERSTEVEVDKLHDKIRELLEEAGGVNSEFHINPAKMFQRLSVGANRPQLRSRRKGNRAKNRYKDLYPYDFNQVQLTKVHSDPLSTYINASYINGYFKPQAYIVTQGPKQTTVDDFWRMVVEKGITRVVMLTNHVEKGVVKCDTYWLDGNILDVGRFQISVTQKQQRSHWTFRKINATSKETGESLVVNHFHFTVWSNDSTADELALAEFVFRVRRTPDPNNSPLLVHCSAGIGRTGTYIAVDYLLDQGFTDHKVDVFGVVNTMRQQRHSMVQNEIQYLSVYTTLCEALLVGDTALPLAVFKLGAGQGTFTMGNITVPQLIQKLGREKGNAESGGSYKNTVRVNRGVEVLTVIMPSRLSLKGYLVTEAPSVTMTSSFWQLTTSHDSSTVIVLPKSQQMLPCFLPPLGSSLDLTPVSVKCSSKYDISPDIVLINVERKMEGDVSSRPVCVYLLKTINPRVVLDLVAVMESRGGTTTAQPVTVMFGEGERRMATLFCILSNILQGMKYDNEVEVYNNIRRLGHLHANDLTQDEISVCYDLASTYLETENVYANM